MINKILKQTLKNTKTKTKKEELFINTNRFNNQMGIQVKIDKISLVLFDNTESSKFVMLQVNLSKLLVNMKMNSRLRNKENMSLALYEIITADVLPMTNFNLNQLAMYLDVIFSVDANYHNIMTNKFEPLLERFETSVEMMQTAPFFRAKTNVIINDIGK